MSYFSQHNDDVGDDVETLHLAEQTTRDLLVTDIVMEAHRRLQADPLATSVTIVIGLFADRTQAETVRELDKGYAHDFHEITVSDASRPCPSDADRHAVALKLDAIYGVAPRNY